MFSIQYQRHIDKRIKGYKEKRQTGLETAAEDKFNAFNNIVI